MCGVACALDLKRLPTKMEELCDWVHSFKVVKLHNLIATSVSSVARHVLKMFIQMTL
jgi:hypothetical protein